jgi:IS5 family transposase
MLGRQDPQLSFGDFELHRRPPADSRLSQISAALAPLRPVLELALQGLYGRRGRPGHQPLILFRALLLQRWFKLSDPRLEAELRDRLSWQQFCGLSLAARIPDETTFCRFRTRLKAGLGESLFQQVEAELHNAGQRLPQD